MPSRLKRSSTAGAIGFTRAYWLYMVAGSCFAAGLMSFEFIAYHLSTTGAVRDQWLPIFLAISTAFAVVASLVLGRTYDRIGIAAVVGAVALTALFSPVVFFGGVWWVLVGLLLWGVGYAVQDTLLKVLIASGFQRPAQLLCIRIVLHRIRRWMAHWQHRGWLVMRALGLRSSSLPLRCNSGRSVFVLGPLRVVSLPVTIEIDRGKPAWRVLSRRSSSRRRVLARVAESLLTACGTGRHRTTAG